MFVHSAKNLFSGCTSLIQPCDVGINAPIKSRVKKKFDEFISDPSQHTFTKGGNIKSMNKTQICNTLIDVLKSIDKQTVVNSFKCCGLSPDSIPLDITCMKTGRPAESAIDSVREFWFDTKKKL